jgi:exosome complex component RRP42
MDDSTPLLSRSEMDFIREGCHQNCRVDGRGRDEYRGYRIVTEGSMSHEDNSSTSNPPLILSNGSARLFEAARHGHEDVSLHMLCSVKAEVVHPSALHPAQGAMELHVESLSSSGPNSQRRKTQDELEATLSKLLMRDLVDLEALCIVPYHYVWRLHVDLFVLTAGSSHGSLCDAASHVIRAALQCTRLPAITSSTATANESHNGLAKASFRNKNPLFPHGGVELMVDGDLAVASPPPGVNQAPIIVSVTVLANSEVLRRTPVSAVSVAPVLILDATPDEEACAVAQVHVAIDRSDGSNPLITALHQSRQGSLPLNVLTDVCAIALQGAMSAEAAYVIRPGRNDLGLLQEQFLFQ